MPEQSVQLISSEDTQEEVDVKESITELAGADAIPTGLIAMWHGLLANVPDGWVLCDGNNGTPNLLDRFVQGVATDSTDPGSTGGATAKATGDSSDLTGTSGTDQPNSLTKQHNHSISDIRPKYFEIAFIMKS